MTPHLFLTVMSTQSRKLMSYRADFWITAVLSFVVHLGVAYYLWQAVFAESDKELIGGYTFRGMVVYFVVTILLGKIIRGNAAEGTFVGDIYEGGLTRYMIYPTSYFLFKYAQRLGELAPAVIQTIVFGIACVLIVPMPAEIQITPLTVLMGIVSVVVASILYFVIYMPVEAVAFWADNVWSLNVMVRFVTMLLGGAMIPLTVFPEWAQQALRFTPFPHIYHTPVAVLIGRASPAQWIEGLLVGAVWIVAVIGVSSIIWGRGYRQYTGVGI